MFTIIGKTATETEFAMYSFYLVMFVLPVLLIFLAWTLAKKKEKI